MTEPPDSPFPVDYAGPRTSQFLPIAGRAKAAIYSLIAAMIIDVLLAAVMFGVGPMLEAAHRPEAQDAMLLAAGLGVMFAGCAQLTALIVAAVLFCMWIHRASRSAHYFFPTMRYSPAWAVGWFFIPIMNWFRPFQVVSELWRVSDSAASDTLDYRQIATPSIVPLWWFCYLVGGLVCYTASQISDNLDLSFLAALLNAAGTALVVVSGILVIRIIRFITDNLEARYTAMAIPAPAPQA